MNIYQEQLSYCVYLTIYRGNKMPPFYIGSTNVRRIINENYHGTVRSKKYRKIWEAELKDNPHLFRTRIMRVYSTREEAMATERRLQKSLGVIKSPMYINCAVTAPNGFFGTEMAGELNPQYGKAPWNKGKKTGSHSEESNKRRSKTLKGRTQSLIHVARRSTSMKGKNTAPQSEQQVLKKSKTYLIITPDGDSMVISNLKKFCRETGLHQGAMASVARGGSSHHKRYVVHLFQAD